MSDYIEFLAEQAKQDNVPVTKALDEALAELDREFETLAGELEVEHVGPGVGMADMQAEHVYKLVVRYHVWDVFKEGWGLKVCDALPNCEFRPMWPVQGVNRLRKKQLVQGLPEFFAGFADAVKAAGKADTPAGQRALAMAAAFGA
jgi:hypothetical protein